MGRDPCRSDPGTISTLTRPSRPREGTVTAMGLGVTTVRDAPPLGAYSMQLTLVECCVEARACSGCGGTACFEHSLQPPVVCELNDFTCGRCHEECMSVTCALEHADPDM